IPGALHGIAHVDGGLRHAVLLALAVTGVIIVTRFALVEITTVVGRGMDKTFRRESRNVGFRQRTVTSWTGFRGAVSLAAALAVPLTTTPTVTGHSGAPFPDRSLIIFVVVFVILVTVLFQGSTLPFVVRWARLPEDVARAEELQLARCRGAQAAIEALPMVATEVGVDEDLYKRLKKEYEEHAAIIQAQGDPDAPNDLAEKGDLVRKVRLGVLDHKRQAITQLRDQHQIDDIVLRELQATLDLEEVRLLGSLETG
ncbi:MAG: cation:proton antiporter, partial [Mycobacterium sp.]